MSRALIFFLLTPFFSFSQHSILEVSNPAPRAGDETEFSVTFKREENKTSELSSESAGYGTLHFNKAFADTGRVVVGPLQFNINGERFETNTMTLHIQPPLPNNIRNAAWIRQISFEGKRYLIIEQRLSIPLKKDKDDVITIGGDDETPFAELDREKFESHGLNIISSRSASRPEILDQGRSTPDMNVRYRISTYVFEKTLAFKGRLKLDKTIITNLPAQVFIEKPWIE
jgi:hypothetical protein